jgi:ADP-ribose pyrophosphatase YjhB (NUDIX family)
MSGELPVRRVVRAAIVDPAGRVLLVRVRDERTEGTSFWALPGGGVENGESSRTALARELSEELLVESAVGRLIGRREHVYPREGEMSVWREEHYLVEVPQPVEIPTGRWWTLDELAAATEPISPPDLPQALASALEPEGAEAPPYSLVEGR